MLHDENVKHRKIAVWTLGKIAQRAGEAVPALLAALRDTNEEVRKMARESLEKISPSSTPARAA